MMKLLKHSLIIAAAVAMLSSCHAYKNVSYLQDFEETEKMAIENIKQIKIQPLDQLAIIVTCQEPRLSALFNLMEFNMRTSGDGAVYNNQQYNTRYTVDKDGNIMFPVLGKLHIEGLTREQVAEMIKQRLEADDLVKDPVVSVEFLNLHYSVLGEVKNPGNYTIKGDRLTILDALASAGDLTIFGKRDHVFVIREENGKRSTYKVDLRSKKLFESPVYYIQQNDVIYVDPNKVRAGQSTVNENNWKSVSLWTSLASLLISVCVLIFR